MRRSLVEVVVVRVVEVLVVGADVLRVVTVRVVSGVVVVEVFRGIVVFVLVVVKVVFAHTPPVRQHGQP